jgi:hypothetical protein
MFSHHLPSPIRSQTLIRIRRFLPVIVPFILVTLIELLAGTRKDDGPFRSGMAARMERLKKGDRIIFPRDRCRRLHINCPKHLIACVGYAKKPQNAAGRTFARVSSEGAIQPA